MTDFFANNGSLVVGIIIGIVVLCILISGYIKASPNELLIISGIRKKARYVTAKAAIKIPFFEKLDKLSLEVMQVDVKTPATVPTKDYINISVDAVVNVKIPSHTDAIAIKLQDKDESGVATILSANDLILQAQQNFLNTPADRIIDMAKQVLEGNTREIVGQMALVDIINDRQRFAELVKENAAPDLAKLGLTIVSFNVQSFSDENHVITDLGIDNTAQIQKNASIAKANAEKEVSIAKSSASKEANDAKVAAELEIAQKNTDLEIKKAELKAKSEIERARAEKAFDIQDEEQRKILEITKADANIARQQKEVEVKEQDARIKERALEADVRKVAEANKYSEQQAADAKLYSAERQAEADLALETKQAEADLVKAQRAAEAEKARAEAARYAAEQEAEGIRAKGLAEAEAIRAAALAEAEGLDKKAEAMKKMEGAAVISMIVEKLPEIAKAVAEPLSNIDSIKMYGEGNVSKLVGDVTQSTNAVSDGLMSGMGIDLKQMISSLVGANITGAAMGRAAAVASTDTEVPVQTEDTIEVVK